MFKRQPYPVDPVCVQVADHFLSNEVATQDDKRQLAEDIQKLCEDFCIMLTRQSRANPQSESTP